MHANRTIRQVLVLLGLTGAMTGTGSAGIAVTKHNLTGSTEGPVMSICVFCHTPLGDPGDGSAPTWELAEPLNGFTMFDDLGRLDPNREVYGSVSAACLSCHDGAQADNVTAISFDHPYGVPYRGTRSTLIDLDSIPRDSDGPEAHARFLTTLGAAPSGIQAAPSFSGFREPDSGIIDNTQAWWLETGGDGRQRTDIKLYARHFGNGIVVPYIECASCHDPHTEAETFLRVDNRNGSRLCLGCHEI
jgi:predicted CXXCH cytochrome family protein